MSKTFFGRQSRLEPQNNLFVFVLFWGVTISVWLKTIAVENFADVKNVFDVKISFGKFGKATGTGAICPLHEEDKVKGNDGNNTRK